MSIIKKFKTVLFLSVSLLWLSNHSFAQKATFDNSHLKKAGNYTYYTNENLTPEQIDNLLEEAKKKQKTAPEFIRNIEVVEKNPTEKEVPDLDNDAVYQAALLIGTDGYVRAVKALGNVPFTLNLFIKLYCVGQYYKPALNKKEEH